MNDRRLSDHIKDHYAQQQPREELLTRLLEQQETTLRASATQHWHVPRSLAAAVALVAVLASTLLWRGVMMPDWAGLAANEVALNHRKQLAPEFEAADYAPLRTQMGKLDFVIVAPARVPVSGLRVIGARYCSIQGHLAAQIKLRDPEGRDYTLYQTHLQSGTPSFADTEYRISGVHIQQWEEDGLFFALATAE